MDISRRHGLREKFCNCPWTTRIRKFCAGSKRACSSATPTATSMARATNGARTISDADLVTTGITEDIPIKTATGTRTQHWFYPGRQDCLTCHTPASGGVLGVKTPPAQRRFQISQRRHRQPASRLESHRPFRRAARRRQNSALHRLVAVTNTAAPLELRVRSYLDANCAQCHRPGGVEAFFDARFDTPLKQQSLINGPVANPLGISGAKIIVPGDMSKSILFHRVSIVGNGQMPPLARNVDRHQRRRRHRGMDQFPAAVAPALPQGWKHADIGNVGVRRRRQLSQRPFQPARVRQRHLEHADAFHFAGTPLTGDGQIIARVVSMQYTDPWAKAGVMFRENFSAGSKDAMMIVTAGGGSVYQRRVKTDGPTWNTDGPAVNVPCWVRLVRAGDMFTGYVSADGTGLATGGQHCRAHGQDRLRRPRPHRAQQLGTELHALRPRHRHARALKGAAARRGISPLIF